MYESSAVTRSDTMFHNRLLIARQQQGAAGGAAGAGGGGARGVAGAGRRSAICESACWGQAPAAASAGRQALPWLQGYPRRGGESWGTKPADKRGHPYRPRRLSRVETLQVGESPM